MQRRAWARVYEIARRSSSVGDRREHLGTRIAGFYSASGGGVVADQGEQRADCVSRAALGGAPAALRPVKAREHASRCVGGRGRVVRHLSEMVLAMIAGMAVLGRGGPAALCRGIG